MNTDKQREDRQVRGEYRLTEREQKGQGLIQAHRDGPDRPGVNTGLQREMGQVRG